MGEIDENKEKLEGLLNRLIEIDDSLVSEEDLNDKKIDEINDILMSLNSEINDGIIKVQPTDVKIKKLIPGAIIPKYSKPGDAGLDLTITSIISETDDEIVYGYGLSLEIPQNYVGLVFPRSSVSNYDLSMKNSVGVVDSGYRGEIMSKFRKHKGNKSTIYNVGDRGAQIIILPYPTIRFIESDDLSETERGEGGYGSSGK
jgi:dUTP pyrophosphatase